jgi:AraC-like DNA-binding protein
VVQTGWYVPREPPADLADILVCSWIAKPSGVHRLVPDGCMDLLWTSSGEVWLCGPETTAWTFALPSQTNAVGVRFRSGIGAIFAGVNASTIVNKRLRLEDLNTPSTHRKHVREHMAFGPSAESDRLIEIEGFVRAVVSDPEWIATVASDRQFATTVLLRLTQAPRLTRSQLADELGINVRQLHRVSLRCFGYGTATLSRLLRFQRFLALMQVAEYRNGGQTGLSAVAIEAGYSDHAHLVRDCRSITNQTPSQFLFEYFPTFPDMSDPYKTDEQFAVSMAV